MYGIILISTLALSHLMIISCFQSKGLKLAYSLPSRSFARKLAPIKSRENLNALWGTGFFGEVDPGAVKGTNLRVLKYPHPQLRKENAEINIFDNNLKKIADEMLLVMYASEGIGLAAPQVGINQRLMVFNEKGSSTSKDFEMVLINPRIVAMSEEKDLKEEGCLSFPLIHGFVSRSVWVQVQYVDVNGASVETKFQGLPARIFQHEYDHLDKVLFIDRMEEEDKKDNKKRLEKYVKKYGAGGIP